MVIEISSELDEILLARRWKIAWLNNSSRVIVWDPNEDFLANVDVKLLNSMTSEHAKTASSLKHLLTKINEGLNNIAEV